MNNEPDYQLSTSASEGILEVVLTGSVNQQTIDSVRTKIIAIIHETQAQAVACDTRAFTGPRKISEAYFRTRSLPGNVKILPVAIVDQQASPEYVSFYETTAANAGISMKWFTNMESARTWLKNIIAKRQPPEPIREDKS